MTHPFTIWTDRHIKPLFRPLLPYSRVRYGDIDVHYKRFLDGGGEQPLGDARVSDALSRSVGAL